MKGGKRLTEEERARLANFLRMAVIDRCHPSCDYLDDMQEQLQALIGRDDDPKYCTCGHARGMHSADIWACDDCGKPVKEE
jgi:hypothetical protein